MNAVAELQVQDAATASALTAELVARARALAAAEQRGMLDVLQQWLALAP